MPINKQQWLDKVSHWKNKWPQLGLPEFEDDSRGINLYKFLSVLNQNLKDDSCIVSDAGSTLYAVSQSLQLKNNQRYILDGSQGGMGGWQSCIGVSLARDDKETLVITGDGSIMCGIESLAVIKYHRLNIKIFVWSNGGYLSIKNSQIAFYGGRIFGTDTEHGLFFPNLRKVADSYGIKYMHCGNNIYLDKTIKDVLGENEPVICEISCDLDQKIMPSLAFKNGKSCKLDCMSPFLSDEEIENESIKD
jgi:acetolactate synthase-1/2/3 large subunit